MLPKCLFILEQTIAPTLVRLAIVLARLLFVVQMPLEVISAAVCKVAPAPELRCFVRNMRARSIAVASKALP